MATIKVKFRASSVPTNEGTLFYQVIHHRTTRQIHSGYKIYPTEWDADISDVILRRNIGSDRRKTLFHIKESLARDLKRLTHIIARLERAGQAYTSDQIIELFHSPEDESCLIAFGKSQARLLKQIGKARTAETYQISLDSFARYRKGADILLEEVDSGVMMEYESYLKGTGICPNTSSFYMRNLRAIYNRAVEKELTVQHYPFKHVYTGIDKTVKRAVSLKVIRQIRNLDLTTSPEMDYARDLFIFSFYTRGMSFIDMAFLKKKDLRNGILTYRRKKTDQQLFIKWEKPMQDIIDKYNTAESPYLLPIIKHKGKDERLQYKNKIHLINSNLKKIGMQLSLPIPLTTYVARHAWASIAQSKNIPLATISEAMGHDSENTTRIYLSLLNTSAVDKANSLILESL